MFQNDSKVENNEANTGGKSTWFPIRGTLRVQTKTQYKLLPVPFEIFRLLVLCCNLSRFNSSARRSNPHFCCKMVITLTVLLKLK